MSETSRNVESTTAVPCHTAGRCAACHQRSIALSPPPRVSSSASAASSSLSQRLICALRDGVVGGLLMRSEVDLRAERFRHLVAMAQDGRDLALVQPAARQRRRDEQQHEQSCEPMHWRVSRGTLASAGMMPQ